MIGFAKGHQAESHHCIVYNNEGERFRRAIVASLENGRSFQRVSHTISDLRSPRSRLQNQVLIFSFFQEHNQH